MGIYLNPGNQLFLRTLNSKIYVDKTDLIRFTNEWLNTEDNLICVSRPRRFGKSVTLNMLAAYYSRGCDSRAVFSPLKIAKNYSDFETHLNRYHTLSIDMQSVLTSAIAEPQAKAELRKFYDRFLHMSETEKMDLQHPRILAIERRLVRDLRREPAFTEYVSEEDSLGNALLSIYSHTGEQFILLIDEWDSIFRNYEQDTFFQDKYIDFLRSLFKNNELLPAYALVYMTGILPIKRYGTQSALNNFREYTMLNMAPLEKFTGFTEEETRALYTEHGMDMVKAEEWYDGYRLSDSEHIYNPNSVVQSIIRKKFANYWTATGTYESVKQPIEMDFDGLKEIVISMLGGGKCKVNVTKFQNDMTTLKNSDNVLTLLIHLGYLSYDFSTKEACIPNKEIRDEFVNAIDGDKWPLTYAAIARSGQLLADTLACDEDAVAACIAKVHEDNTSILHYNDENSLSCVIQLAYYKAQDDYLIVREMPSGKGFADIAFIPRRGVAKPAMIVELKWKKDVQTAISQIHDKNYSDRFRDYLGEVLLVGINYEKGDGSKTHRCRIERVYKNK